MKKVLIIAFGIIAFLIGGFYKSQNTETFRLGIDPTFIPLNLMGQETRLNGYCQDLFKSCGQSINQPIALVKASWDDLLPQLKNNQLDGIITTLSPYNFYKKDFIFSDPLLKTGPCLVSLRQNPFKNLKSLEGKIIGIIAGSNSENLAAENSEAIIQSFDQPQALLDALVRGQIDVAFLDYLTAFAYCQDLYQKTLIMTSAPFGDAGIRLMIKKNQPQALKLLKSVDQKIGTSEQTKLLEKWQLPPSEG